MKELQRILACVDLSEYSKLTMDYAVGLAKGLMTDLTVLNVINIRDVEAVRTVSVHFPQTIDIEHYVERTKKERIHRLQAMIDKDFSADKERIHTVIKTGIPFKTIMETIDKENFDLVVIGNKGWGNLVGTLFGSNADKIFRHSKVPVLSVRKNHNHKR